MTGILISLSGVLLAIVARLVLRRPLWSIEKMPLAIAVYVAAFWGYLDLRGNGPMADGMVGVLIGAPLLWILKFAFNQSRF